MYFRLVDGMGSCLCGTSITPIQVNYQVYRLTEYVSQKAAFKESIYESRGIILICV